MRALARDPGDRFPPPRRSRTRSRRRRPRRGGRAQAAVGRGAAVPQPERRPRERVLRRRDHRGRDRPALEDPRAQGDLARLGHGVQAAGAESPRDRRRARRRDAARGQRAPGRRPGADRRPAASTRRPTGISGPRRTTASSPTSSRSRPTWRCRSPRAQGGAVAGRADPHPPRADRRRPGLPALPPGAALLHPVHRGEHPEGHRLLRGGDRGGPRIRHGPRRRSPWPMPSWRRGRAAARCGRTTRTTWAWRPSRRR